MEKAVFFDLDGTLWDREQEIPDSTKKGLLKLHENGIAAFINTGRTMAFVRDPKLEALKLSGIIAGCGTHGEYQGETIFYHTLDQQLIRDTVDRIKKYHYPVILEGCYHLYVAEEDFGGDSYIDRLREAVGGREEDGGDLWDIEAHSMDWEVSKFTIPLLMGRTCSKLTEELSSEYEVLMHGHQEYMIAEGVPKGFSKATGIQNICRALDIPREHTYAFGDSANDVSMLEYAAHGISMGNASKEAIAAAEYTTDTLENDGIYKALIHYGLI